MPEITRIYLSPQETPARWIRTILKPNEWNAMQDQFAELQSYIRYYEEHQYPIRGDKPQGFELMDMINRMFIHIDEYKSANEKLRSAGLDALHERVLFHNVVVEWHKFQEFIDFYKNKKK